MICQDALMAQLALKAASLICQVMLRYSFSAAEMTHRSAGIAGGDWAIQICPPRFSGYVWGRGLMQLHACGPNLKKVQIVITSCSCCRLKRLHAADGGGSCTPGQQACQLWLACMLPSRIRTSLLLPGWRAVSEPHQVVHSDDIVQGVVLASLPLQQRRAICWRVDGRDHAGARHDSLVVLRSSKPHIATSACACQQLDGSSLPGPVGSGTPRHWQPENEDAASLPHALTCTGQVRVSTHCGNLSSTHAPPCFTVLSQPCHASNQVDIVTHHAKAQANMGEASYLP